MKYFITCLVNIKTTNSLEGNLKNIKLEFTSGVS